MISILVDKRDWS